MKWKYIWGALLIAVGAMSMQAGDEAWRGNRIGEVTGNPPPPWTALETVQNGQGVTAKCWGRTLEWRDSLFPSAIDVLGQPLLAAPVRLEAQINGAKVTVTDIALQLVFADALTAQLEGTGKLGNVPVVVSTRVEFDGLMVVNIRLAPETPVTVESLKLVMPLPEKLVKFKFLPVYSREQVGAFPAAKPLDWSYPFIHYVWVGDEERGLTWFSESADGWSLAPEAKPIRVRQNGDSVDWSIEMIGKPTRVTAPVDFSIGLQPTPVKPMPSDQLQWGIGRNFQLFWTRPEMDRGFGYPEGVKPGVYDEETRASQAAGMPVVHYGLLTALAKNTPEWEQYGREWNSSDIVDDYSSDVLAFGSTINMVCPAVPEYRDFITWKMQKWVDDNNFDGLYHDLSGVHTCASSIHGCDGKMPILAWRELYKRVYTMLKERPQPTIQIQHVSWGLCSPILAFCDAYMNGEQYVGRDVKDYPADVPLDLWLTEFTGRQYGVVPIFIPALTDIAEAGATRRLTQLLLLHGAPGLWPHLGYLNRDAVTEYFELMKRTGLDEAGVEFLPYWGAAYVTGAPEELKVSAYRHVDGTVTLVCFLVGDKGWSGVLELPEEFREAEMMPGTEGVSSLKGKQLELRLDAGKLHTVHLTR